MRISDWSSDVCSSDLKLLNSYKILSKDRLRVIEQIYIIHEANSLSALHLSRKLDKLQKLISDHFCRIDSLRQEINTTPGVYFPTVLSESCRIFRRYTRLRFKPVRKVVRSEARRVGKECVRTCGSRWSPCH